MKLKLTIVFRPFNSADERRDAGYFNGLSKKRNGVIEINTNDDYFEQMLTLYHEMTHMMLELICQYERKHKKFNRRDNKLKEEWKKFEGPTDLEEALCIKVEDAVKPVLLSNIPKIFFNKFFKEAKKKPKK